MQRAAIKRRKPLRNKAPAPAAPPARARQPLRAVDVRSVIRPATGMRASMPKEGAIEHEGYKALVRLMACRHCGIVGYTQFCHADMSKGQSIKTDCRRGWPGCGPHTLPDGSIDPGCHWRIGTARIFPKQERRELEEQYGRETRDAIERDGLWPKDLPRFGETS
jgi:hypothetical protein